MTWWSEPSPAGRDRRRDAASGFTLLEMVVVLAILGFAALLITGYKPPWSGGLRLRGIAADLAADLRLARSDAIAANRPVAVELDLATRRYRVGEGPPHALPAPLQITLLTIAGEQLNATTASIRFNPDGSSTGGRITLRDGSLGAVVGVDWLSGRVSIADDS